MIVQLSWCNVWDIGLGLGIGLRLAIAGIRYRGPSQCIPNGR